MADVANTLRQWSVSPSSNMPGGTTIIGSGLDNNLQQIQATVRQFLAAQATNMPSAATVDLSTADGYYVAVTGTTPVTALGTEGAGISYLLKFTGVLTFTHNGTSLILPGGANITTAAGDLALMMSEGAGNWRCAFYQAASGAPTVDVAIIPATQKLNLGLAVAVAASAMTISLKGADGNDPSATNPVKIAFRSSTLEAGTANKRSVTSALSTIISSGSTGGSVSAWPSRIWVGAIDNAGTVELAWFNAIATASGIPTIFPINEGVLISTTAEGGAGAADSAGVWYSTTARSNVPLTILGYVDSTQTTAGTWAATPTAIMTNPANRPGHVVQRVRTQTGTAAAGTTTIPFDDTIPQSGEGDQYMTQAITPTAAVNVIDAEAMGIFTTSTVTNNRMGMALFRDSGANAIAAQLIGLTGSVSAVGAGLNLKHAFTANQITATTLKIRAGGDQAGTTTFNGSGGSRAYGGVLSSYLEIKEVSA